MRNDRSPRRNELPVQRNFSIFNMSNYVQVFSLSGGFMEEGFDECRKKACISPIFII